MQPIDDSITGDLVGTTVEITRAFDAPRELVFQAWTDPRHVARWFGPKRFTIPHCEVDPRPGGKLIVHMQSPEGDIYPSNGIFEEVEPPKHLVLTTTAFEDETGSPQLMVRHTVTFEESAGKTTMTLRSLVLKATPDVAAALSGMEQGWNESFEKLEMYLAKEFQGG